MGEWINYILCNWQTLLVGGSIVVGVVIFLMGILKKFLFNKIPNKLARKIVLSFVSLALVFPATVVSVLYNNLNTEYFWLFYTMNSVSTILIYWFYENTGLRNLLYLIGENTVIKLLCAVFKTSKSVDGMAKSFGDAMEQIDKDTKSMLKNSKYKEEDLKNL